MKRGSWEVPRLTGIDVLVVIISLLTQAVFRSWDYSTGSDEISASLTLIEDAIPLWGWGVILGTLAVALLLGITLRVHLLVWSAHSLLAFTYAILMVGMIISVLNHNPFPWDGIRGVTLLMTPAILHAVLAIRTGPTPLPYEYGAEIEEAVIKQDG